MAYRSTHRHARRGARTPTYQSWAAMKTRCTNPSQRSFRSYGGRGITVCDRWKSFENFLADMGERPDGATLDRINSDGNYEPNNCRWATRTEQARNTTRARLTQYEVDEIRFMGEMGWPQWKMAMLFGVRQGYISKILARRIWA